MTYISQESFRSSGGARFYFGQEIGDLEYNRLTREEKMKFRRKYSDSDESSYGTVENDFPSTPSWGTQDDSPSSSHHESHSFGGWGGGDSGGGGSDSSWDSGSSDSGGSDGGGGGGD